jgi:hypothetical protein
MNEEFKSSACPEFEPLLEDHVSGDLGGPDLARLSEHLKSCAGCRAAFDLAAPSARLFAVAEATPEPALGFAHVLMARIRDEQARLRAQKSIWQPFVSLAWRFAATASLAAVVLLAYDASSHRQAQEDMAVLLAVAPHDLVVDAHTGPQSRDQVLLMMAETDHGKH